MNVMPLKHMLRNEFEYAAMDNGVHYVVLRAELLDPSQPARGASVAHEEEGNPSPFYLKGPWTVVNHPAGRFSYCVVRHDGTKLTRPIVYIDAGPAWSIRWHEGRPVSPAAPLHLEGTL